MSDLFGNHIVGFPTRRLNYLTYFASYFQEAIVELRKNLCLSKNGPSPVYKANDCQRNICVLLGCLAEKLAGQHTYTILEHF